MLYDLPAITHLVELARAQSARFAYPCVIERSDRSESRYLHICRARTWYGIRIACHEPFHDCSADYLQLLIPAAPDANCLQRAEDFLRREVQEGGRVVADPREVEAAMEQARLRKCDGQTVRTGGQLGWRWSADLPGWVSESREAATTSPPTFVPRAPMSAWETCAIRHRLNFRANWAFDEGRVRS